MFRKELLELLRVTPRSVADIARLLELEPKDVEDDLRHLIRTVKHTGYRVTVTPAQTPAGELPDLSSETGGGRDVPLEFYLDGNVVFRQGDRIIYADRMYYNVQQEYGVVLNGELLTPMPGCGGLVRLKAEVLRQVDRTHFQGANGAVTTSRLGLPSYWLQSGSFDYVETPAGPQVVPGSPLPATVAGEPTKRVITGAVIVAAVILDAYRHRFSNRNVTLTTLWSGWVR